VCGERIRQAKRVPLAAELEDGVETTNLLVQRS
jgi:hypothetical protein